MRRELYILDEDKSAALKRIVELEKAIQDLGPEFYDVFNQSSETWHDNAPFDALREKQSVMDSELQGLKSIIKDAATRLPKQNKKIIGIGARVVVEDVDSNKTHTYYFAGNWTYRTGQKIDGAIIMSTEAPLAKALMGKKIGDTAIFKHPLIVREIVY